MLQDRGPLPSAWPGLTKEASGADQQRADLPPSAYPIHSDPSTATQHPQDAFPPGHAATGDAEYMTPATRATAGRGGTTGVSGGVSSGSDGGSGGRSGAGKSEAWRGMSGDRG